jgi:hypothetical protein
VIEIEVLQLDEYQGRARRRFPYAPSDAHVKVVSVSFSYGRRGELAAIVDWVKASRSP